jgi:hypothetical protein
LSALSRDYSATLSVNWIINRRMDLTWFIGAALGGYTLFFMHAGLGWDMVGIWFLWVVFLDTPHFFGTFSRTYLDKREFQRRRKLLTWSLLWFLAGPAMILLGYGLFELGVSGYQRPWKLLLIFLGLWAYWHVVRQHYGFMRLYQKKNADNLPIDARLDSTLLYAGLLLPFLVYINRHPETRVQVGLSEAVPAYPPAPAGGRLMALFDLTYLNALSWEHWLGALSAALIGTLAIAFLVRQAVRIRHGEKVNGPKILFMLAVVPLHVYVCFSSAVLTAPLLAFGAFVTIFHDFQYHAIIWFHQRNRYHRPEVDQKQFGWASKVSGNLFVYAACAVGFAAIVRLLGCTFALHPGCTPVLITSEINLFGAFNTDALLKGFLVGFALHHYFVDQFIWKTGRSEELQNDLKLTAEGMSRQI